MFFFTSAWWQLIIITYNFIGLMVVYLEMITFVKQLPMLLQLQL